MPDVARTLDLVRSLFEQRMPYNKLLGFTIQSLSTERASLRFEMRDDLVGNIARNTLHGGVISAALDVVGGLVAVTGQLENVAAETMDDLMKTLAHTGTIDLRVDYLRPGRGEAFVASGFVLRSGSRLTVTRMELANEQGDVLAVGTGAYSTG